MNTQWPFLGGGTSTVESADGPWINLEGGQRILDAAGGAIVANIGHGNAEVADAIAQASARTSYAVPPWRTAERDALLEELHTHWIGDQLGHTHLTSGGSEGIESAIKMAIQYHAARGDTSRTRILTRDISYHGTTITTAGISGHPARKIGLEALLPSPDYVRAPYPLRQGGPASATQLCLESLREVIDTLGAGNIAALVAEPVTGTSGGAIVPPPGYWSGVQQILNDHGILLIVDEVMTGFGRLGAAMGAQLHGIEPDILVGGKGLAGGYAPICGVFGTTDVADAIRSADYNVMFHTFGALPASCAAAATVLRLVREGGLIERAAQMGAALRSALEARLGQHPLAAEVRGQGLLQCVEVVRNRETLERFPVEASVTNRLVAAGMREGVFFYPGGTGEMRDLICMGPPFTIGDAEIELMVATLGRILDELAESV